MLARLGEQGPFASGSLPDEFAAQIRKEVEKMRRVSRFARITLDGGREPARGRRRCAEILGVFRLQRLSIKR